MDSTAVREAAVPISVPVRERCDKRTVAFLYSSWVTGSTSVTARERACFAHGVGSPDSNEVGKPDGTRGQHPVKVDGFGKAHTSVEVSSSTTFLQTTRPLRLPKDTKVDGKAAN